MGYVLYKQYGFRPADFLCQHFPLVLLHTYMSGSERNKDQLLELHKLLVAMSVLHAVCWSGVCTLEVLYCVSVHPSTEEAP